MNNTQQQELVEAKKRAIAKVKALLAPVAAANRFMTVAESRQYDTLSAEVGRICRQLKQQFGYVSQE